MLQSAMKPKCVYVTHPVDICIVGTCYMQCFSESLSPSSRDWQLMGNLNEFHKLLQRGSLVSFEGLIRKLSLPYDVSHVLLGSISRFQHTRWIGKIHGMCLRLSSFLLIWIFKKPLSPRS
jgi:hypothetical protein